MDAKTIASLPPKLLAQYLRDPSLQMAMQYQQEASDTSPVQHWTQGAARLVKGLLGGIQASGIQEQYGKQAQNAATERQMALASAIGRPAETQQVGDRTINWQAQQPNFMSAAANLQSPDNADLAEKFLGAQISQNQTAAQQQFAMQQQDRSFQQQQAMQERLFAQQQAMNGAQLEKQMAFERYKLENDPMKQLVQQYLGQSGQGAAPQPQGAIPAPPTPGQLPAGIQMGMTQQEATAQPMQPQSGMPSMQDAVINGLMSKKMGNPPEGMMWGRGGLIANPNPKITDEQAKAAGYYQRMREADSILGGAGPEKASMDLMQQATANIPVVGNNYVSPDYQKAQQAQRNFINSILRRESGAVISPSEFDNARLQYFPQYGDSQEVLLQKARNRQNSMQGVLGAAGPARNTIPPMQDATQTQDTQSNRVNVLSPDGVPHTIDASELQEALNNGWRQQ